MKPPRLSIREAAVIISSGWVLILWLFANIHGVAYTNDSHHFAAAGHSFWQSGQWINADGAALTHWQPLYPTVLGFFLEHSPGIFWLHLLCLLIFLWGMWQLMQFYRLPAWCHLAVAGHPVVLSAFSFAWTEALALPLLLWFVWHYEHHRLHGSKRPVLAFLLIVALSWCRFAFLPAVYTLLLWDAFYSSSPRQRRIALQLFMVSLSAVAIWVAYAYSHQNNMIQNYGMWEGRWPVTLLLYLKAWGSYFAPATAGWLLLAISVTGMAALIWDTLRSSVNPCARRLMAAAGVEFFFLLLVNIQSYDDQVRYLLPVWIFCLLGLGKQLPTLNKTSRMLLAVWLLSLSARTLHATWLWHTTRQSHVVTGQPATHTHVEEPVPKASVHKR